MAEFFENAQWRVTRGSLEAKSDVPTVYIPVEDLLRKRQIEGDWFYEWPLHIAENTWTDFEAFEDAFRAALQLHAEAFDRDRMEASIAKGKARAKELQKRG